MFVLIFLASRAEDEISSQPHVDVGILPVHTSICHELFNRGPRLGNIPVTTTTKIFKEALQYKWEPYCNTNGRRTAIQMEGVLTVFPFLRA